MAGDSLDTGVIPENSRSRTVRFSFLDDTFPQSQNRQEWLAAFEQCFQFTLRSLSFPSPSGLPSVDLELDTRQSVLSILASGLPLPKSPSIQLDDSVNGQASDAKQLEREERGWWSLRFQQVLREMQRQDWTHIGALPSRPLG